MLTRRQMSRLVRFCHFPEKGRPFFLLAFPCQLRIKAERFSARAGNSLFDARCQRVSICACLLPRRNLSAGRSGFPLWAFPQFNEDKGVPVESFAPANRVGAGVGACRKSLRSQFTFRRCAQNQKGALSRSRYGLTTSHCRSVLRHLRIHSLRPSRDSSGQVVHLGES